MEYIGAAAGIACVMLWWVHAAIKDCLSELKDIKRELELFRLHAENAAREP